MPCYPVRHREKEISGNNAYIINKGDTHDYY
ncbi:hypothetical protein MVUOKPPV_CDS0283 [Klebsiella phage phi1_175008]|uniref:Uncharacterized protein n=1 Tax=Klebsiella phage phi1_175008 TaxID=3127744 RepID=A0ACD5FRJ5_9CAUD